MSLKKNILANYGGQIYVTLIGIVMVPMYIKYMGAETYGLVGFFALMQAWFNLLDMGLTPTLGRETARFYGGATDALSYRHLVCALEVIFLLVALVGGTIILTTAGYIARDWLQASQLPIDEVITSIQLMAIIIAMRWMSGLYRSIISGSERLVWLSGYNIIIATLRFVVVLPLLMFVSFTPAMFFEFQLVVAVIELAGLLLYAYRLLPAIQKGQLRTWDLMPLKSVLKFSSTVAFASSVWVISTQTDKLILSKVLPLAEYGYFTLAVLVGSGVLLISGPVSTAIMPRMAKLESENDHLGLLCVYHQATQLVAVLASASAITMAFCAEQLLWAWTGDRLLAQQTAPVLILYALGNGILAVATFPYYLQYAKGDLRLHLIGNAAFVVILIPSIIWAASNYGGVGAGYVWLGMNLISFIAWLPLVHRKFDSCLNTTWYFQDVLIIFAAAGLAGYGLSVALPKVEGRSSQFGEIVVFGIIVMSAAAMAASAIRPWINRWLRKLQLSEIVSRPWNR